MRNLIQAFAAMLKDETGTVGLEYGTTAGAAAGGVAGAVGQISDAVGSASDSVAGVLTGSDAAAS